MKANFTIEDNYAVVKEGNHIDLHNNLLCIWENNGGQ
jgi:hypothetical protein